MTTLGEPFAPLDRLGASDLARVGGKAFNCARLKQAGFPVPDGLVVFADTPDDALAAVTSHQWFESVPPDCLFAVRSSGVGEDSPAQSFAGIHETLLNVPLGEIAAAVATCRASARSPRAYAYRKATGLDTASIEIGVLIQRMVQPTVSGVGFTVNPLTGQADEIVINAARGLGEALVSGAIDPDEYIVRKGTGEMLLCRSGDGGGGVPAMHDGDIAALAQLLREIEVHYGAPQDVEWCCNDGGLWIVQSRPVTATKSANGPDIEWTRANLAEVMPDLTSPQALAVFEELLNAAEKVNLGGFIAPESELGPLVKSFAGRPYFNISQMRRVSRAAGMPPAVMLRSMGHSEAISAEDETAPRLSAGDIVRRLPDFARILSSHLRAATIVRATLARSAAALEQAKAVDPSGMTDAELWTATNSWRQNGETEMQTVLLLAGVSFHERPVRQICDRVGFPFEHLVYPQLAAGERSVSSQQAFDLVSLADKARQDPRVRRIVSEVRPDDYQQLRSSLGGTEFLAALDRFLENYGHRGRYESDWALPRLHEDPTPLFQAIRAHLLDDAPPANDQEEARRERAAAAAWTAFIAKLSWWQRLVTLPRVRSSVATIKRYYVWRERVRSDFIRVLAVVRRWHLALADRFVQRGWLDNRDDYFLVLLPEIGAAIDGIAPPETLRQIVAARRAEQERYRQLRMPLFMKESDLHRLVRASAVSGVADADGESLTGMPVSGGCVEAHVVVVRDPADFERMTRGAILVAPATDPSWTPLFTLASGVIVEVGGVLSHASTIAREFGLPAIANVKNATRRLKTGDRVRLDAMSGQIHRIAPQAARS
jgi:phosphohistidine swiveling domain-containing protein